MIKIYLDTSVISALFDSRTPERQLLTQEFWKSINDYEVYISDMVIEELSSAVSDIKSKLLELVKQFFVLKISKEAEDLAQEYIDNEIFPVKYYEDALHTAIASVNYIDYLISWNFKHLVKVKTRRLVTLVNTIKNYRPVEIISPPEL
jgi:predicted nucleic acid-binding protein